MAKYTIEIKDNTIVNITPITKAMEIANAKATLEEYVGDHIAVIGKGRTLSENQKRELRRWADILAPIEDKCSCYEEGYADGYADGYAEGTADTLDELDCDCGCNEDKYRECEPNCGCHDNGGCKCSNDGLEQAIAKLLATMMAE